MRAVFRLLRGRAVRLATLTALSLVGTFAVPVVAAAAPGSGGLGTGPLTPLAGSVAPVPAGAAVLGPTAPDERLTVDVALLPRDPAALADFARAVSTPGNPRYRHFLPAGSAAAAFGPAAEVLRATRSWLASSGLSVGSTSPDGLVVPVTGTASQVESAFAVPLVRAHLTDGRTVRLATRQPSVPSTLVPVLQGVLGLSDQALARPHLVRSGRLTTPGTAGPSGGSAPRATAHLVGPQPCATIAAHGSARTATDLASTYGLSSLYGAGRVGAGQTVGLFELEEYTPSDIAAYQACYGTNVPVTNTVVAPGASTTQSGEAALDIEVVAGLAPGSSIRVYTGPNDGGTGPYDTYHRMVQDDIAKVISTSWGQCEPLLGNNLAQSQAAQLAEQTLFTIAAAQGQTVVAASGDSGSVDCYPVNHSTTNQVDDPAAQPYVTGVGGTILYGTAAGNPTEAAWGGGASSSGAGGGGSSITFPGRQVPDVSASADGTYGDIIYFQGTWGVFGGTSMAAPLWAALVALVNQGCATPAGWIDPQLRSAGASTAFNDVTVGNNSLSPFTNGFPATVGYDMATGRGSPRAVALLGLLTGAASGCPAVTGLAPPSGPSVGGTTVVIAGSGFGANPTVAFAGTPAAVVAHAPNGTSVTVVAPAGTPGSATVSVTNGASTAGGTSAATSASSYTYIAPRVASVTPSKGPVTGGGTVVIRGTGFEGVSSVRFGASSATFTVNADGTITATVPPGTGGTIDVIVQATAGTSVPTSTDHYTYVVPGYWMVGSDGGIFAYGAAGFFGSAGGTVQRAPFVALAPTPDGAGYWLGTSGGGVFAYGDAGFYGSAGNLTLNKPIVGMASTADGAGYWLVASDGGIFAYGDAGFYGSTGNLTLNKPIVGMATDLTGTGYWLVASDGGIFAFGSAPFYGSTGNLVLNRPITGMAAT